MVNFLNNSKKKQPFRKYQIKINRDNRKLKGGLGEDLDQMGIQVQNFLGKGRKRACFASEL